MDSSDDTGRRVAGFPDHDRKPSVVDVQVYLSGAVDDCYVSWENQRYSDDGTTFAVQLADARDCTGTLDRFNLSITFYLDTSRYVELVRDDDRPLPRSNTRELCHVTGQRDEGADVEIDLVVSSGNSLVAGRVGNAGGYFSGKEHCHNTRKPGG